MGSGWRGIEVVLCFSLGGCDHFLDGLSCVMQNPVIPFAFHVVARNLVFTAVSINNFTRNSESNLNLSEIGATRHIHSASTRDCVARLASG